MMHSGDLEFSFSGLKTSALTLVQQQESLDDQTKADIAASFQAAIVDVLCAKSLKACAQVSAKTLVIAGGVGANASLRERLTANKEGIRVQFPPLRFCTDNGAMIAFAAAMRVKAGLIRADEVSSIADFSVKPRWDLAAY
jgi:N6-L-threonylcarbamoyladenine synthase